MPLGITDYSIKNSSLLIIAGKMIVIPDDCFNVKVCVLFCAS